MRAVSALMPSAVLTLIIFVLSATTVSAEPLELKVVEAVPGVNYDGRPSITITLSKESQLSLAKFTAEHVGRWTEVRLQGRVLMKALLRTSIEGGRMMLADSFSSDEARSLAVRLSSGDGRLEIEVVPQ
jgi:preprotein translocase subunit SecD